MKKFVVRAPAKINLGLRISGRTASGYHEVETIMMKLPLADQLSVELLDDGIDEITCDDSLVPRGEANLINKALRLAREYYRLPACRIHLQKNIPMGAGLGGGSSDAGSLLAALNQECDWQATGEELEKITLQLGADVPFFVRPEMVSWEKHHGLAQLQTRALRGLPACQLVLVYQPTPLDTASMYAAWDEECQASKGASLEELAAALARGELRVIGQNLTNDFELVASRRVPRLSVAREKLLQAGALGVGLTGKGPTLFGLFAPEQKIEAGWGPRRIISCGN